MLGAKERRVPGDTPSVCAVCKLPSNDMSAREACRWWLFQQTALCAVVVVGKAGDVVFAEIGAELDFDEDERSGAVVVDAVFGVDRDVDDGAGADGRLAIVERDDAGAGHDRPFFGAAVMELVAQAVARIHFDTFDLKRFFDVEHLVIAPGTDLTV